MTLTLVLSLSKDEPLSSWFDKLTTSEPLECLVHFATACAA
jgi:hypothetical protein